MAVTVALPKLGMTMESAKVSAWLKADGDTVRRDEPILTIETDKAVAEVAAPADGILVTGAKPGDELPVGAELGLLAGSRAEYEALRGGGPAAAAVPGAGIAPAAAAPPGGPPGAARKLRVAPAARAIAAERGIDLALVPGTGPDGRISKEDVLEYEKARAAAGPQAGAGGGSRTRVRPRSERRRIVAAKMAEAAREAAQATHAMDVDATALVALRQAYLARAEHEGGARVTITDLVMKLTALAIRQHPIMNSRYTDEADILFEDVHMGMAMSVGEGDLLVPVIRGLDTRSVADIAESRADCQARAKQGRLLPDDLSGSTFTVSSLGMFGLDRFVAILNRPENAILAVGAILDRPWVVDGRVVPRKVMTLTLTYDHRTIYGAEAARFMATLRSYLEHPETAGPID